MRKKERGIKDRKENKKGRRKVKGERERRKAVAKPSES